MGTRDVAIVVTCYNQSSYTKNAIASLKASEVDSDDYRFVHAVFDDCSTDDTREFASSAAGVTYWCSKENSGLTHLWNAAFQTFSDCEYLVLVNNDVLFTPGWCRCLLGTIQEVQCEMAGPVTNAPGHVDEQNVRHFIAGYQPSDDATALLLASAQLRDCKPFAARRINGFCMAFRTDLLARAQVGRPGEPFDPSNRDFGTEDEFQRTQAVNPWIVPSSFVFHYKRVSFQDPPRSYDLQTQIYRQGHRPR